MLDFICYQLLFVCIRILMCMHCINYLLMTICLFWPQCVQ